MGHLPLIEGIGSKTEGGVSGGAEIEVTEEGHIARESEISRSPAPISENTQKERDKGKAFMDSDRAMSALPHQGR